MKKIWLVSVIIYVSLYATKPEEPIEQIKLGNFALPSSQQVGPLFSFGQTLLEKGTLLTFVYDYPFRGCSEQSNTIFPTIIYGLSDSTSLLISPPIITSSEQNGCRSSGWGDTSLQLEQQLYGFGTLTYITSITGIVIAGIPTGSPTKNPPTGSGSPRFLVGLTASFLSIEWYAYTSPGIVFSTEYDCTKNGTQFLYQGGFGKNLGHFCGWIVSLNFEINGNYTKKSCQNGIIDENSGGNIILAGPALWVSSERWTLQAGINGAIYQRLNGQQSSSRYLAGIGIGWTFGPQE